jgi:hypothetical protein
MHPILSNARFLVSPAAGVTTTAKTCPVNGAGLLKQMAFNDHEFAGPRSFDASLASSFDYNVPAHLDLISTGVT